MSDRLINPSASPEPPDSVYSSACSEDQDHTHTLQMAPSTTDDTVTLNATDGLVFGDLDDPPLRDIAKEDPASPLVPNSGINATGQAEQASLAATDATNGPSGPSATTAAEPSTASADAGGMVEQEGSGISAEHVDQELKQWEHELDGAELQEFEAEFQEFEREMKPLTQQLDQLQQQLEAAALDPSMNQELQQIQQKLMQPPKPRQRPPPTAEQQQQQEEEEEQLEPSAPAATSTSSQALPGATSAVAAAVADKNSPGLLIAPEPAAPEAVAAASPPFAPEEEEPPVLAAAAAAGADAAAFTPAAAAAGGTTAAGPAAASFGSASQQEEQHEEQQEQELLQQGPQDWLQRQEQEQQEQQQKQQQKQQEQQQEQQQEPEGVTRAGHVCNASAISFGSIASDSQLESFGPGSEEDVTPAAADSTAPAADADADADAGAALHRETQPAQRSLTSSAFAAAAQAAPADTHPDVTSSSTPVTAAAATATGLRLSSSRNSQAGSAEGSRGSPVHRQASYPLSPQAMSAVAPPALAPPRTDLDLRRLSMSSSPDGGLSAEGSGVNAWSSWAAHRRHFFVLTSAGKPVFSRHGDEGALAGFMAIIQAVVSVVADQGDCLRRLSVGPCQLVFLLRGHLYFVAVSSRGEHPEALRRQLHLLHLAILMSVTNGVERMLTRNPGYDVRQLLQGAAPGLRQLLSSCSRSMGWMLEAVEPLGGITAADREVAGQALKAAVMGGGALYGLLTCGHQLLAADCGRSPPLHPLDVLLLMNFTTTNESLRQGETFVPLCLPHFQPSALLHAYVACLDPPSSLFLLLLGGTPNSFHALAAQRVLLEAELLQQGVAMRVADSRRGGAGGRPTVEQLPPPAGGLPGRTPLWHYAVRFPQEQQYILAAFPPDLFPTQKEQKEVIRAYSRLHCAAYAPVMSSHAASANHGIGNGASGRSGSGHSSSSSSSSGVVGGLLSGSGAATAAAAAAAAAASAASSYVLPAAPPRASRLVWVSGRRWVGVVSVDKEVELYLLLDPLSDHEQGARVAQVLRKVFGDKARQAELLVPGL